MAFYGGGVRQRRFVAENKSTPDSTTASTAEAAQGSSPLLQQTQSGPMPTNPFASPPPLPSRGIGAKADSPHSRSGKNPFAKPFENPPVSARSTNPFAKTAMPPPAPTQLAESGSDVVEEVDVDTSANDTLVALQLTTPDDARVPGAIEKTDDTPVFEAAASVVPVAPSPTLDCAQPASPTPADAEKVKTRITAADVSACTAALSAWDASLTSALHRRAPLADIALTGKVPLAASLDVWSRLAGSNKAATHGRSLEELLLLADGPGGVPAGNDGTFGGNADEESALMVTRAVRHHIRKDLKRTRVVPEFEAAIDPDPERGSLYRVLAAYACLDPHTGYVQGMNFIAALLVTPTVLAQQNASSPTSALASTKAEEGSSSAVTTITTTATAAAAAPASFQGCPLSMEDERAAFELFVRLMQASGLRRVFDARDDQLHCLLMRLEFHVEGFLPFLHEHLNQEEVPFALFAVEWFTTLFVYNFNFETSRAALSLFLVEGGMVFTVQLGIALLYKYQEHLLMLRFETLVPWLKKQLESLAVDELLGALQQLGSLRALQRESYAGLWDFTRPDVTVTQIAAAAMTRSGSNSSQVRSIGIDAGSTLSAESSVGNSDHLEAVQVVVVRKLVAGQSYRVVLPGGRTTTELFPVGAKVGDTLTIHVPRLSENGPQDSSSSQALQLSAVEASTEMSGVDDGVVVLAPSQDTNGPENSESILVSSSSVNVEAAEDAAWVASRLKRPRWMPDDEVLQCSNPQCRRRFSNLTAVRRHHCRACGSVVCGACSRGKASLPLLGYDFSTLLRVCTPCLEAGAGAAATHEARERKAADPQVRAAAALAGVLDNGNDEDSDYEDEDDSTGVAVHSNSHNGNRRVLGYVCDLPTISYDVLDDGTTSTNIADDEDTTSTTFSYANYMPLKFGMSDLRRHLVLGRSSSDSSKAKSLTNEVEEAHRSRKGSRGKTHTSQRQSTVDPLSGAIVYFYETILESGNADVVDLEGKTNADMHATPLPMATEFSKTASSNPSPSDHPKSDVIVSVNYGDSNVALTLATALGAVLGDASSPSSESLEKQEQLNDELRQAHAVVDEGAPLPPEAFTSRTSARAGESQVEPNNNHVDPAPASPPPPYSPDLKGDDGELDAPQHGPRRSIHGVDVVDTPSDDEEDLRSTIVERTESDDSVAITQARHMHREGVISAEELSEVITRDRTFSANFNLDESDNTARDDGVRTNEESTPGEKSEELNYEVIEAEELAGAAFRALRVACGIQLSAFAHSLGGGPLLTLSSPDVNNNNSGSASTANVLMSHDQKFVLKDITPREAALLLALLPDYFRHISANASHTLLPKFLGLFKVRFVQQSSSAGDNITPASGPANLMVVLPNHMVGNFRPEELPAHVYPTSSNETPAGESAASETLTSKIASLPPPVQLQAVYDLKGSTRNRHVTDQNGNVDTEVSNRLMFALLVARANGNLISSYSFRSPLAVMMAHAPECNSRESNSRSSSISSISSNTCCVLRDLNFCPSHGPGLTVFNQQSGRRSSVSGRRQSFVENENESDLGTIGESNSSGMRSSASSGTTNRKSMTGLHLRQRMRDSASRLSSSKSDVEPSDSRASMEDALSKGIAQRNQNVSQPSTPLLFQPPLPPPLPVTPPCRKIMLGAGRRATFLANVRNDVAWLREHGLVDYSLLLGVGTCSAAAVIAEELALLARNKRSGGNSSSSSTENASFWEDYHGGVCAPPPDRESHEHHAGADHRGSDSREWYTFGIVNILQRYDARSIAAAEVETSSASPVISSSSSSGKPDEVSAANPALYAGRFVSFLERHIS